jgi:hypothetical protein
MRRTGRIRPEPVNLEHVGKLLIVDLERLLHVLQVHLQRVPTAALLVVHALTDELLAYDTAGTQLDVADGQEQQHPAEGWDCRHLVCPVILDFILQRLERVL